MLDVYLNDKIVFTGDSEEVENYCNDNEWDYVQDNSYKNFEILCGIYCLKEGHYCPFSFCVSKKIFVLKNKNNIY